MTRIPSLSVESAYEIHELAELIPAMSDDEYARLRDDIAANGLLDPITLYDGKVLDGRHRLRACEDTATEPRFSTYGGSSPAQFVLSHNLHRRHLSVSQRAMIATDFLPHLRNESEADRGANLRTAPRDHRGWVLPKPSASSNEETLGSHGNHDRVAHMVGVGNATVSRANRVARDDPGLADQVRAGELTVNTAHEIVKGKTNGSLARVETGANRPAAISRIAEQAEGMALAIGALNLTKSCARMTEDERQSALASCKAGLRALNTMAKALGR